MVRGVSVPGAVAFAVRFTPRAWRAAGGYLALGGAAIAARAAAGPTGVLAAAASVLAAGAAILVAAALYRLALSQAGVEPASGAVAAAAARLAVVAGLAAVLILVLGAILLVALLAVAYGVASTGAGFVAGDPESWGRAIQGGGRWVLGALVAIGAGALAWLCLRLSLAPAATVARGRVQVLSAWPLTRGAVTPILASVLAVNVVPVAVLLAAGRLLGAAADGGAVSVGHAILTAVVVVAFMLPLNVGAMTYLYSTAVDAPSGAAPPA